ncbi:MAG: hypothetical protein ACKVOR_01030 [Flavobacteriales bacterium]
MKALSTLCIILHVTLLYAQEQKKTSEKPVYVGVLETKPISWGTNNYQEHADTVDKRIVRPMFYKQGSKWYSLQEVIGDTNIYPDTAHWTIAFDGKSLGKITSSKANLKRPECQWCYPRDAHHNAKEKNLPVIGEPSSLYGSWAFEKEHRPLVTVSKPNYADPEQWKPFQPDSNYLDLIFTIYKSYYSEVDSIRSVAMKSDMRFLKSYQSANGNQLIQVVAKLSTDVVDQDPRYSLWILKTKHGELINLTRIIDYQFAGDFEDDDMCYCTLIDAGDYDSNGQSEILFKTSRYNGDGYVMFYNDFVNMVDFNWNYH